MTVLENMQAVLPSLPKRAQSRRIPAELSARYPAPKCWDHCTGCRHLTQCYRSFMPETRISGMVWVQICLSSWTGSGGFCTGAQHPDPVRKHYPKAPSRVSADQIQTIVQIIHRANRVITLGNYHSGMSAQQMAFRLNRSGIDSHFMNDTSQMECYVSLIRSNDVIFIFLSAVIRFMNPCGTICSTRSIGHSHHHVDPYHSRKTCYPDGCASFP